MHGTTELHDPISRMYRGLDAGEPATDGMWLAYDGANHSADWHATMPRTRWSLTPAPGTALLSSRLGRQKFAALLAPFVGLRRARLGAKCCLRTTSSSG
jgi:hypothetical protein